MKVHDKVWVVTGGGNGMGRELVLLLLTKGARVVAVDINAKNLAETATLAGERAKALETAVLDITDRKAVAELPDKVVARFGSVDGLINNAGIIQPFVRMNELGHDVIDRVFNVNFHGTLNMTKAFLPRLLGRPEAHLVNISSMGGFVPFPGQVLYGASKAAVKLLTEGLASELAGTGVKVTVVFPGAVLTNITANSGVTGMPAPPAAAGKKPSMIGVAPADAAKIILKGVERNRVRVLVGTDARIMDFLSRLAPRIAARLIEKVMRPLLKSGGPA
jgi:short-subunit dehydrogenase